MLNLVHAYQPTFGNGGDKPYKIICRPMAPELIHAIREKTYTDDSLAAQIRAHMTDVVGLTDTDGKPVTGAAGLDALMEYPAFVGELLRALLTLSPLGSTDVPTSGRSSTAD